MQPDRRGIYRSEPRIFRYSLDWRFLLPLSNPDRLFIIFENERDFCQTLEHVGIPVSNQFSFLDIERKPQKEAGSFVFPFGLSVNWVSAEPVDQIEFFRSMRTLMGEHGNLLVGFNNAAVNRSRTPTKYYASTPQRMTSQLQKAGFQAIRVFGAIPNLNIPEYMFDLDGRSLSFALQHRFKRKPILLHLLQLFSYAAGVTRLFDLLPCYFIGATV